MELTTNLTMISIKSLIVVVLLAIYAQNIEGKNVDMEVKQTDNILPAEPKPLQTRERDLRGIGDIWGKIKSSTISFWDFMTKNAENTRDKISEWVNNAKEYAEEIKKTFEEQLQDLQKKLDDIIIDLLGTGELVRECLKTEGKNIQDSLKSIINKMSECVSNQIKQLAEIQGKNAELSLNDTHTTTFMTELDKELNECENKKDNYEECLYTVREIVFDQMELTDDRIQKINLESRKLADEIRETVTVCSLQNLAEASSYITSEMLQVVKCVLDSKGINQTILG